MNFVIHGKTTGGLHSSETSLSQWQSIQHGTK